VELPVVPGTHDVVAVERAFPERPPEMIADAGYRAELTVLECESDLLAPEQHLPDGLLGEFIGGAHIDPGTSFHVCPPF
jgi:hypothetical protein